MAEVCLLAGCSDQPPRTGDFLLELLELLGQQVDLGREVIALGYERGDLGLDLLDVPIDLPLVVTAQGQLEGGVSGPAEGEAVA
jgi:hypothetical protein